MPRWVEELDGVSFGPLGEHRLLCDEAVPSVRGALVKEILCTLVPAAGLVVVVGNFSVTFRLAVGVIYHAVDMDLFAHVHCEDEREPASAEVRAGLNPVFSRLLLEDHVAVVHPVLCGDIDACVRVVLRRLSQHIIHNALAVLPHVS